MTLVCFTETALCEYGKLGNVPGYRKVYGNCENAVLESYDTNVRDCAQKCDRNPKCYSLHLSPTEQ